MSLTNKTIELVSASVPALEQHGKAIVIDMYDRYFKAYPDDKKMFNMSHQIDGDGSQVEQLANTILAYAKNINNIQVLLPKVEQIVQKHCSVNVKPQHYERVGTFLLEAIQEQLSLSDSDPIIAAWGEAYWFIANFLIELEKREYNKRVDSLSGWEGYQQLRVLKKESVSADTMFLKIGHRNGSPLPKTMPFQYITLYFPELKKARQYSLVSNDKWYFEIAVKRIVNDAGEGVVSNHIHDVLKTGDRIMCSMPSGGYDLALLEASKKSPVCLLSGGIGLTPHLSLMDWLVKQNWTAPVYHFHSARSAKIQSFSDRLAELNTINNFHNITFFSAPDCNDLVADKNVFEGYLDAKIVSSVLDNPTQTLFFVCGPRPYMREMHKLLSGLGVNPENVHYEFFGPASPLTDNVRSKAVKERLRASEKACTA